MAIRPLHALVSNLFQNDHGLPSQSPHQTPQTQHPPLAERPQRSPSSPAHSQLLPAPLDAHTRQTEGQSPLLLPTGPPPPAGPSCDERAPSSPQLAPGCSPLLCALARTPPMNEMASARLRLGCPWRHHCSGPWPPLLCLFLGPRLLGPGPKDHLRLLSPSQASLQLPLLPGGCSCPLLPRRSRLPPGRLYGHLFFSS
jgi:hypothetical protein